MREFPGIDDDFEVLPPGMFSEIVPPPIEEGPPIDDSQPKDEDEIIIPPGGPIDPPKIPSFPDDNDLCPPRETMPASR